MNLSLSKEKIAKNIIADIKKTKETDDLSYAVSWRRAFTQLNSNVSWLQSYCTINYIAAQKILKKFKKSFKLLNESDDIYDKLLKFTKSKSFVVKGIDLISFRREISLFYADYFKDGDVEKAHSELQDRMTPTNKKDLALIYLFIGMIISLIFSYFLLIFVDQSGSDDHSMMPLFTSFSFSFMIIFCFFGIGINIQVFRRFRINYIYIFEIDPITRLSQQKIYRVI